MLHLGKNNEEHRYTIQQQPIPLTQTQEPDITLLSNLSHNITDLPTPTAFAVDLPLSAKSTASTAGSFFLTLSVNLLQYLETDDY